MKRVVCDTCHRPFTKEHNGMLYWKAHNNGSVYAVGIAHNVGEWIDSANTYSNPCDYPRDSARLYDCPLRDDGSLPRERIEEILSMYQFTSDDESWLRETFSAPRPPTLEERVFRLERLLDEMTS